MYFVGMKVFDSINKCSHYVVDDFCRVVLDTSEEQGSNGYINACYVEVRIRALPFLSVSYLENDYYSFSTIMYFYEIDLIYLVILYGSAFLSFHLSILYNLETSFIKFRFVFRVLKEIMLTLQPKVTK